MRALVDSERKNDVRDSKFKPRIVRNGETYCIRCDTWKPLDEFNNDKNSSIKKSSYCKPCCSQLTKKIYHQHTVEQRENFRSNSRKARLKREYGITVERYQELLKEQNFMCVICTTPLREGDPNTHIDHCHKSGVIRGILCTNCNRGLGHLKDSMEILEKAIRYLEKFS